MQLNRALPQIKHQQEEIHVSHQRLIQSRYACRSVFFHVDLSCCFFSLQRSILHQLIQIIQYRQREIISEISHYIYPITHENQKGFSIANLHLPPAEDKIYQSASSKFSHSFELFSNDF